MVKNVHLWKDKDFTNCKKCFFKMRPSDKLFYCKLTNFFSGLYLFIAFQTSTSCFSNLKSKIPMKKFVQMPMTGFVMWSICSKRRILVWGEFWMRLFFPDVPRECLCDPRHSGWRWRSLGLDQRHSIWATCAVDKDREQQWGLSSPFLFSLIKPLKKKPQVVLKFSNTTAFFY